MVARGPLKLHPRNPRYFADPEGRAVYLSGTHTWNNLVDQIGLRPPLDFEHYLEGMAARGENFLRLWTAEHAAAPLPNGGMVRHEPLPFVRSGPGVAFDGRPRFDLTQINPQYLQRLRVRLQAAAQRGVYVSVMLFEGWAISGFDRAAGAGAAFRAWQGHPFQRDNNVNGIDGDPQQRGDGALLHSLALPQITALQLGYLRMLAEALNDCDNLLWEIANESQRDSVAWQYLLMTQLRAIEARLARQHPIGMTALYKHADNRALFASPADWISPAQVERWPRQDYRADPPAASGRKVILSDTDHLFGIGGSRSWVWKSCLRGLNPIVMDDLGQAAWQMQTRQALGQTRRLAEQFDLAQFEPQPQRVGGGYCLARRGMQPVYLIYLPPAGTARIDLHDLPAWLRLEWLNLADGSRRVAGRIRGGAQIYLAAPGNTESVAIICYEQHNREAIGKPWPEP